MNRLTTKIQKEVVPAMQKHFGFENPFMSPRIEKVVVNVGLRSDIKDAKVIDEYIRDLKLITGQNPVKTKARQSISSFKIRQGQVIGLMVTLRGQRMYEFLDKLLNITLARVRDFRGLEETGFDKLGNYTMGLKDQISFPEISPESLTHTFGLQISISVNANKVEHAKEFLRAIGLPLKRKS